MLRKHLLPNKFQPQALHSASGASFIAVSSKHVFFQHILFSSCPFPGCFCFSRLSHHVLLFYASGSFAFQSDFLSFFSWPRQPVQRVLTVTVDTLVPVFSYTVSEISKKFLFIFFPGNNMLVFLGVCVCVCVVQQWSVADADAIFMKLVPNPLSFCWYSGKPKGMVSPPVQRTTGGRLNTVFPGITTVWMLVDWIQILQNLISYSAICSF